MCGIAGIIASSNWDHQALRDAGLAMAMSLQHRGPDAQGVWVDPQQPVMMAHRRLSIQDLSNAGSQPMASASGRFQIVFNGEIYNFQSLSDELVQLGHIFRGHSDTEVLLAAIEEWGIEQALQKSRGMFAFAVWDLKSKELILCRDRLGEKPLFFGWLDGSFVFSSELKALNCIFHSSLTVDRSAVSAFFRFGYVPNPHTIYENVFKLPPGTFLRIPSKPVPFVGSFSPLPSKNELSPQAYWQIDSVARQGLTDPVIDESEAIEQLDVLLRDVIIQQKIADVPIGAFLSGGVDSSLVAAVMQEVSDKPINTFTIGFNEKEFDEAPYARAIAKHLGSEHHEYYVSDKDGLAMVEDIPYVWDEPFADSSQIPSMLVAKMARQKVTVCLTGDGGDELFCGYNRYFATDNYFTRRKKVPTWLCKATGAVLATIPISVLQQSYMKIKCLSGNDRFQANVGLKINKMADLMRMPSKNKNDIYRYLMSYWQVPGEIVNHEREAPSIIDRCPDPGLGSFLHDAMYWDQLGYLVDDNLVKGDRASMSVSLEARLPLLDHRIVELSWRLPLTMKYRDGQSKWLLRQLLDRYVPRTLIERPKMGFSVPLREWFRGPMKEWAGDLIHSSIDSGINPDKIQNIWRQHLQGSHDHSHQLWTLCMWLIWLDRQRS